MIGISAMELRKRLYVKGIMQEYNVKDERLRKVLERITTEDLDMFLSEYDVYTDHIFDFEIEHIHIPSKIHQDHAEMYNYYMPLAFQIPGLMQYTGRALLDEFGNAITVVNQFGGGNTLEFVYLPTSNFATSDEPGHRELASYPASFMIGIQDNGCTRPENIIQFLMQLREINDHIMELIV